MVSHAETNSYPQPIEIEGLDGAGKTTQVAMLADWWNQNRGPAVVVKELESTQLGRDIREILRQNSHLSHDAEMSLFLATKAELLRTTITGMREGGVQTICDRGVGSFLTYFRNLGYPLDHLEDAVSRIAPNWYDPRVVFIDVDPSVTIERSRVRGVQSRFDTHTIDYFAKVRTLYLGMAAAKGWSIVEGNGSINETLTGIIEQVQ